MLQLSRVALNVGEKAEGPVVWFDLDSASLIELPQSYEKRGETTCWYEAPTVPYQALLEIGPGGFVRSYPGSLAARGVSWSGHASAASRSMRKARAAGSVCSPIAR